ncbi:BTB/POZ protein [Glomus cerebriforme]|uniref:BTB/POZ protein n=1 Tax=Glomus cerebriforme TaxID=658196 RepID=A0A397SG60_9GLOM|nr:BTB/POZ protein [Glomus cerebriforme]
MDDNKLLPKLSQNLLEILDDEEYYDITIEVGNDPYVKIFRAHMVILSYRSPYLRRILSANKKKNDDTLTHIKLPNISPEIFQIILRYIYGGRLFFEELDTFDVIKVLSAASELYLQELITYLQFFLIENKTDWMEQNFDFVHQTSFENDAFSELQKYCTDLISKEPDKIFKSQNFSSIPEKLLVSIVQNDNLQMDEIQVWEHVIKWGTAQNPELPSDVENYSDDNFNTLKNTLRQCIPFVRFYNLTSKEFLDRVLPYDQILPKELYKDLLKTFLSLSDPNSKPINKSKPRITKGSNFGVVRSAKRKAKSGRRIIDKFDSVYGSRVEEFYD